jgi:hypothetical protein
MPSPVNPGISYPLKQVVAELAQAIAALEALIKRFGAPGFVDGPVYPLAGIHRQRG